MCTPYTYRICRPSLVDLGYLRNLKSELATPIAGDAKKIIINNMEAFRKAQTDFTTYYESLCALQSTYPLASIRSSAAEGLLNCQVNKMKRNDWCPVLTALRANRVMHTVIFCDKWEEKAQHFFNGKF